METENGFRKWERFRMSNFSHIVKILKIHFRSHSNSFTNCGGFNISNSQNFDSFNFLKLTLSTYTAQKKFPIKDFFSKYDQIRKKLRIWSHLLKKFFMGGLVFCAVLTRRI